MATLAACNGRRILVAGDMRELGPGAQSLHAQVGELAKASGIDALYAVGELSEATARAFGRQARHLPIRRLLIEALRDELVAAIPCAGSRVRAVRPWTAWWMHCSPDRRKTEGDMLLELADLLSGWYRGFHLFQYLTFRAIMSTLTALTVSLLFGPLIIRKLADSRRARWFATMVRNRI